jgi:hypothetical protein
MAVKQECSGASTRMSYTVWAFYQTGVELQSQLGNYISGVVSAGNTSSSYMWPFNRTCVGLESELDHWIRKRNFAFGYR